MDQALLRSRSGGAVEPWLSHRAALSLAGPVWGARQALEEPAEAAPGCPIPARSSGLLEQSPASEGTALLPAGAAAAGWCLSQALLSLPSLPAGCSQGTASAMASGEPEGRVQCHPCKSML